jgi:hypothetical protein
MAKDREQVDPQKVREQLLALAEQIHRLEESGELLESTPELIRLMGNLRATLFEYEVRFTGRLLPSPEEPPEVLEAQRIVHEAARQMEDEEEMWWRRWTMEREEEDEE